MIRCIAASASALAVCAAAHAATPLATPAIYGGSSAYEVVCTLSNYSGQTATLASVAVTTDSGGQPNTLFGNTCGKTLNDSQGCYFGIEIPQPPNHAYYCNVQVRDSATVASNMRVTVHVLDKNGVVLQSEAGH